MSKSAKKVGTSASGVDVLILWVYRIPLYIGNCLVVSSWCQITKHILHFKTRLILVCNSINGIRHDNAITALAILQAAFFGKDTLLTMSKSAKKVGTSASGVDVLILWVYRIPLYIGNCLVVSSWCQITKHILHFKTRLILVCDSINGIRHDNACNTLNGRVAHNVINQTDNVFAWANLIWQACCRCIIARYAFMKTDSAGLMYWYKHIL